ncbi:MAG TPA: Ig-like domain-containing protein [Gemmatimonadales bacterium]|nr:Ig-like domain-containing protein [Gemmatimonadales bacterium]
MGIRKYLTQHPLTRGTAVAVKVVAAALSAGAAAVSVFSFARSHGWIEEPPAAVVAQAAPAAVWLGVWPETDTAGALGDTIQLTAALKDAHGALIPGTSAAWSSDDPSIASVDQAGTVVANGEGSVSIVVAAGGRIARSHIAVRPRVATIEVVFDSSFRIPEGESRSATIKAMDARGHRLARSSAAWQVSDSTIARVDSNGVVKALVPGRTMLEAKVEGASARIEFEVTPMPGSAAIVAGDHQRGDAGAGLAQPVVIQVLSRGRRAMEGVPVRFATEAGSGTTTAQTGLTDAQGRAHAEWSLGTVPGRQRLSVSVPGLDTSLSLVAEADPLPANTRIVLGAEPGAAVVGDSLPQPVVVRVTDSMGTALADLPVAWTALDGGKISGLASRTDSAGEARAIWVLGPKAGLQRSRVQVGNPRRLPAFAIKSTATAGRPAAAAIVAGAGQKGTVHTALAQAVTLRVNDRSGNRVPLARILLHPEAGTVPDSSVVTDSSGTVRIPWTLGRAAGAQKLVARVEGLATPLTIEATALAAHASKVEFGAAGPTSAAGKVLPRPVRVTVFDPFGNPLKGQEVLFSTQDGRVAPIKVTTDARGIAVTSWTLSGRVAPQLLTASLKDRKVKDTLMVRAVAAKPGAAVQPTILH